MLYTLGQLILCLRRMGIYTKSRLAMVPNAKCLECLVRGNDSQHCSSLVAVGRIVDDDPRR